MPLPAAHEDIRGVQSGFEMPTVAPVGQFAASRALMATGCELHRALSDAQTSATLVTIDLRRLLFIDCSGLAVLKAATDRASVRGDRFRIVRGPPAVDRLFSLTGYEYRFGMTSKAAC